MSVVRFLGCKTPKPEPMLGELLRPPTWWDGARCLLPKNPTSLSAVQASISGERICSPWVRASQIVRPRTTTTLNAFNSVYMCAVVVDML